MEDFPSGFTGKASSGSNEQVAQGLVGFVHVSCLYLDEKNFGYLLLQLPDIYLTSTQRRVH